MLRHNESKSEQARTNWTFVVAAAAAASWLYGGLLKIARESVTVLSTKHRHPRPRAAGNRCKILAETLRTGSHIILLVLNFSLYFPLFSLRLPTTARVFFPIASSLCVRLFLYFQGRGGKQPVRAARYPLDFRSALLVSFDKTAMAFRHRFYFSSPFMLRILRRLYSVTVLLLYFAFGRRRHATECHSEWFVCFHRLRQGDPSRTGPEQGPQPDFHNSTI